MTEYIADIMAKKIDGQYLVTAISGVWDVLTEPEYKLLVTHRVEKDRDLYGRLAEEGIIITKENVELIKARIRQRYAFLCQPIGLHIIVVTDRCTQQCVYCHAQPPAGEKAGLPDMTKPTADKVIKFILSSPAKACTIEFQGGESLLNIKMVKYIVTELERKKGDRTITYRMATNLSEINERIFNDLLKIKVRLMSSLDGPKQLHDKQRIMGNKSSYNNVIKWVTYARRKFQQNIGLLPTITRYSLQYGVKRIIDEYVRHKIYYIQLRELNLSGLTITHWKTLGYSAEEFFKFWKEGVDYCIKLYEKGIPIREGTTIIILERFLSAAGGGYMCFRSPCGAGINQVSYNPSGDIYFCDASRSMGESFTIGNVRGITYKDLVEKTKALRGMNNLTNSCNKCVWSPYCGTCLLQSYGKRQGFIPIKPRDFHCQLRQKQLEYIIKLLLGRHKNTLLEWWNSVADISVKGNPELKS